VISSIAGDLGVNFALSLEQTELRENVLGFARKSLAADVHEATVGEAGGFRRDLWQRCADFGVLGLPVPNEYGGSGLDIFSTTVAMEALGEGCRDHGLLFSMHAHLWAVITPIIAFGTPDQRRRYVPSLVDGTAIGAHGISEPGSGSDAYSMRTRARRDGECYVLNGTKTFVTNAPIGDLFLVFATVKPERGMWGVTAFLIDKGTPGLSVSRPFKKLGLTTSPMGEVVLDECRVPVAQRLGTEGQGAAIFNHSMGWERSCILASQVGRMQQQLDACVAYAKEREQFGKPIGSFQLIAAKLADMKVRLETSRLLLYRAAWQLSQSVEGGTIDAAMAKLYISECAVASALDAVQIHGGYGYMQDFHVEQQLRDSIGGTLYSGTSEIQRMLIARQLGLTPA
jgi:alkylation response protein AidB-like acyl-CoA dehydrogenase